MRWSSRGRPTVMELLATLGWLLPMLATLLIASGLLLLISVGFLWAFFALIAIGIVIGGAGAIIQVILVLFSRTPGGN